MTRCKNEIAMPITWFGGKSTYWKKIISCFPENYHLYNWVEVFGGGGSLTTYKYPSISEVYNDINSELTNFLEVVRTDLPSFMKIAMGAPDSNVLLDKYVKDAKEKGYASLSPVERAWRMFYINVHCFSGLMGNWHGVSSFVRGQEVLPGKVTPADSETETYFTGYKSGARHRARDYYRLLADMWRFAERWKRVQITNYDFRYIIKKLDSPGTLFYLDPPYIEKGWKYAEMYGSGEDKDFPIDFHKQLAKLMVEMKGKFVLSIDGKNPLADEIYMIDHRFHKTEFDQVYTTAKASAADGEQKKVGSEAIIYNFNNPLGEGAIY